MERVTSSYRVVEESTAESIFKHEQKIEMEADETNDDVTCTTKFLNFQIYMVNTLDAKLKVQNHFLRVIFLYQFIS